MAMGRKYSRDELLEAIRETWTRFGRPPRIGEFSRWTGISDIPIRRVFGSWAAALDAADMGEFETNEPWTRERILQKARALIEPGQRISFNEFLIATGLSGTTVLRKWGKWSTLRDAVGGEPTKSKRRYAKDEVRQMFCEIARRRGELSAADFSRETGVSYTTIVALFGGVEPLREAAGLPKYREAVLVYDSDELVDEYMRLWRTLDRRPRKGDIELFSRFKWGAFTRRWRNSRAICDAVRKTMARRCDWVDEAQRLLAEGRSSEAKPIPRAIDVMEEARRGTGG